ncbi:MAG: hypothetical protein ABIH39_03390, partial [Candidatus Margulisiibacteriota bacterium]
YPKAIALFQKAIDEPENSGETEQIRQAVLEIQNTIEQEEKRAHYLNIQSSLKSSGNVFNSIQRELRRRIQDISASSVLGLANFLSNEELKYYSAGTASGEDVQAALNKLSDMTSRLPSEIQPILKPAHAFYKDRISLHETINRHLQELDTTKRKIENNKSAILKNTAEDGLNSLLEEHDRLMDQMNTHLQTINSISQQLNVKKPWEEARTKVAILLSRFTQDTVGLNLAEKINNRDPYILESADDNDRFRIINLFFKYINNIPLGEWERAEENRLLFLAEVQKLETDNDPFIKIIIERAQNKEGIRLIHSKVNIAQSKSG